MIFTNDRVTQPATEPVTVDEFKIHLRYDSAITTEDALLESLLIAAREWAEDFTGLSIVDSLWRTIVLDHDGGDLRLLRAPVLEVVSVYSAEDDGTLTAVDSADYTLREPEKFPRLAGVTSTGEIRVEFRAGYVDDTGSPTTGVVPSRIQHAILLYAEALYDRDPQLLPVLKNAAEALLRPLRINFSMA